jgi:galactokinase
MDNNARKEMMLDNFVNFYGKTPQVWSRAPGRVDLMGSHTDYNLGFVMTMSIDRDTWFAARMRDDRIIRVRSLNTPGEGEFHLDDLTHDPDGNWTEYVRGVAWALQIAGYQLVGLDGLIHSNVPFGSGLSSSAAIEMATALAFQHTSHFDLDPLEMALLGQRAENQFVGMNCGILDQYSSVMGRAGSALLLDCRSLTSETVPIASEIQVVVCNTKAERNLRGTEYGDRRAQCEEGVRILKISHPEIQALRDVTSEQLFAHKNELPEVVFKRCRFIIEENQRVLDLGEVLPKGDRSRLGKLFEESFSGAQDLYEISAPSMDAMMQSMLGAPGVIAARQAGAGFGGCMVALVEAGHEAEFAGHVTDTYSSTTGIVPEIYPVEAAPGAGLLK